jgi:hypothetical protein
VLLIIERGEGGEILPGVYIKGVASVVEARGALAGLKLPGTILLIISSVISLTSAGELTDKRSAIEDLALAIRIFFLFLFSKIGEGKFAV